MKTFGDILLERRAWEREHGQVARRLSESADWLHIAQTTRMRVGDTFTIDGQFSVNSEPLAEVATVVVLETIDRDGVLDVRVEPASIEDRVKIDGWLEE